MKGKLYKLTNGVMVKSDEFTAYYAMFNHHASLETVIEGEFAVYDCTQESTKTDFPHLAAFYSLESKITDLCGHWYCGKHSRRIYVQNPCDICEQEYITGKDNKS